ncbi:MAG: phosphatidylserine decarboxylase family protein, partial [Synergistaceae bacterium]|nr:phosphatidylserine decarboxylase family protein [Synergistaceae bacterium]
MRVAKEGIPTITVLLASACLGWAIFSPAGALLLLMCALSLWFYRDPDRTPPGNSGGWVSP